MFWCQKLISWYQKLVSGINFWHQKINFLYQKINIKVLFSVPYHCDLKGTAPLDRQELLLRRVINRTFIHHPTLILDSISNHSRPNDTFTVYPIKHAHDFVVLCFDLDILKLWANLCDILTHIIHGLYSLRRHRLITMTSQWARWRL